MKRTVILSKCAAFLAVATILGMLGCTSKDASVAGNYYGSADNSPIRLSANGNWQWGGFNAGKYSVSDGKVVFDGVGGPATWGPAAIGKDSLTFIESGNAVFRKPGPIPKQLLGVYSAGKRAMLEFDAKGSYISEAPHGRGGFVVFGGEKVKFFGGPVADWGEADIGSGTLTFHPGGRLVGFFRQPKGTVWVFKKTAMQHIRLRDLPPYP